MVAQLSGIEVWSYNYSASGRCYRWEHQLDSEACLSDDKDAILCLIALRSFLDIDGGWLDFL